MGLAQPHRNTVGIRPRPWPNSALGGGPLLLVSSKMAATSTIMPPSQGAGREGTGPTTERSSLYILSMGNSRDPS